MTTEFYFDHSSLASAMHATPQSQTVREPRFAGVLYPADGGQLEHVIDTALRETPPAPEQAGRVRVMILPYDHYDILLSSLAKSYAYLNGTTYDTVTLISPAVDRFNRLAISGYTAFDTPLGRIELNDYIRNEYCDEDDDFYITDEGIPKGSSIELQLPLLQRTIGLMRPFSIVPILMGDQDSHLCIEVATATAEIMHGRNALVIVLNNFHVADPAHAAIQDIIGALQELNYGELMRLSLQNKETLGSGLGTLSIAARVAYELGALRYSTIDLVASQKTEKTYLSGLFFK